MIQKCPKCGMWCKAFEMNASDRYTNSFLESTGKGMEIGKKVLGESGETLGGLLGMLVGQMKGIPDAFWGDKYMFVCSNCKHEWWTDYEFDDETENLKTEILDLITDVHKYKNSSQDEKENYISSLDVKMKKLDKRIDKKFNSYIYAGLAYSYFYLLSDAAKAKYNVEQALELYPNNHSIIALKGIVSIEERTALDRYKKLQLLIHYKKEEKKDCLILTKEGFQNYTEDLIVRYCEHFLEIPYMQRRFLVIDSRFDYLPDSFKVLPFNYLPTNMEFPAGHPNEQTLYICHPFRPNYYLPFEEFQLSLFNDEISEFIEFLQALGAKSIDVEEVRHSEKSDASKDNIEASIGVKYKKVAEGKIGGALTKEMERFEALKRKYKHTESSSIVSTPYVPSGLIWYSHRPEWQRLERKRMNGTEEYEEIISTKQYTSGIQNNMQQLSVDFKTLLASANVKGKHEGEKEFSLGEEYELKISVKFHPLSSYQNINKVNVPKLKKEKEEKNLSLSTWIIGGIIVLIVIIGVVLVLL